MVKILTLIKSKKFLKSLKKLGKFFICLWVKTIVEYMPDKQGSIMDFSFHNPEVPLGPCQTTAIELFVTVVKNKSC